MPAIVRNIWLPYAGEQADGAGADHQPVGCGDRHAAGDASRRCSAATRRSPPIPGRSRPTAMSIGGRSRFTSTTRSSRSTTRTCAGRFSHYIDRKQIDRGGVSRRSQVSVAADAALSAAAALFRCGEGPAGEIRHAGIRPEKGRRAAVGARASRRRAACGPTPDGKPLTLDIIGFGAVGAGDRAGAVGDAAAPRGRGEHEPAARLRRPLPEGPIRRLDLRSRRQHPRAL